MEYPGGGGDLLYTCSSTSSRGGGDVLLYSRSSWEKIRGGSRTSIAGGALVTNEAEGFTEARSAERGGWGGHPLPLVGVRGSPPGNFGKFASKWCILSAFRGYLCTYLQLEIYVKNVSHYKHTPDNA